MEKYETVSNKFTKSNCLFFANTHRQGENYLVVNYPGSSFNGAIDAQQRMLITTPQLHSAKPELQFCASSNPAGGAVEIRDGQDL